MATAVSTIPTPKGQTLNPPFHANAMRIYGQNSANGSYESINLFRGAFVTKDGSKAVRFLYNPSQVDVQHSLDPNQTPTDVTPTDLGANNATNSGTVSVSLLFDRTYELWYDKSYAGVLVDVRAFYALTGILTDGADVRPESIHPMQPIPVYLYLGQNGPAGTAGAANTRPLAYFGWISELDVSYTHWSVNMIPMRCVVNISLLLMPTVDPTAGAAASGAPTAPGTPFSASAPSGPPVSLPGPGDAGPTASSSAPLTGPDSSNQTSTIPRDTVVPSGI